MKNRFYILSLAALAMIFASCKSTQPVAVTPQQQGKVEIDLPCVDESYDTEEYFKAMGTATNLNMQNARNAAFDAAKDMLMKRLGGTVKGLATSYSQTIAGDAQMDKVRRAMEGEFTTVVERMINDAQKTCEKMYQNAAGNYESYIAIKVSKAELVKNMQSALSQNQELEVLFNREQFRKFAEEYLKNINGNN